MTLRGVRCMGDRGRIGPDVASRCKAFADYALRDDGIQIAFGDAAPPVRTPYNPHRRVVMRDIIKMNAQRHHRLDHIEWRLDMLNAVLDRPRSITRHIHPRSDCNRAVLMPAQSPVRCGGLVEQDCKLAAHARRDELPLIVAAAIRARADRRVPARRTTATPRVAAAALHSGVRAQAESKGRPPDGEPPRRFRNQADRSRPRKPHSFSVSSGTTLNKSPTSP